MVRIQDFADVHGSEKTDALINYVRGVFTRLMGPKDRIWLGEGKQLIVWFESDTRGRRCQALWAALMAETERPMVFRDINQRFRLRGGVARAVNPETRVEHLIDKLDPD